MAVKFNPFTGQLQIDEKGSGGAQYIDGEVATYNDLPLDGTAALNSAWLVREASGIWPVSRKQAGIYIRTATAGSSRDADYTYAGTMPDVFSDAVLTIYDEASTTRTGQFNLGSITAGQNRVLTWPDGNGTIARTSDIPSTFAASAITSGVFDNARINFASPSAIGSTTASTGAFTTLSASTSLTLGTSGILSGGTNTIEQRNTTSAQTFRIYNTVSGAADANFERGFLRWSSNVLQIGTEKAGTGSARALELSVDGTTRFAIASNGVVSVTAGFSATGTITSSSGFSCTLANAGITFGNGFTSIIGPSTAGVLSIRAFNNTDVLVRLGGESTSWPALNTSGSTLRIRLADNSGFAPLSCGALTLNGNLDASTRDIVTDTTTGTKIGTGTTQKLGFFNATPIVRPAAIADATDAATTQARLNDLLAAMRSLGLIAT